MRNEGGGGIVEGAAPLAVDEAIVPTSFHQSAAPVALLRRLAGTRTIAASAGARRPT